MTDAIEDMAGVEPQLLDEPQAYKRAVLRMAYLRGLEDAAKAADDWGIFGSDEIAEVIRALAKEGGE